MLTHASDRRFGDRPFAAADAQDQVGLHLANRRLQRPSVRHVAARECRLLVGERRRPLLGKVIPRQPLPPQQPVLVVDEKVGRRLGVGGARLDHRLLKRLGHPDPGAAGAHHHHLQRPPRLGRLPLLPQRAEHTREHGRTRPLDVVVEAEVRLAVSTQDGRRLVRRKVLKLQQSVGELCKRRLHEFVDQREVLVALQARLAPAAVRRVIQQRLVVGAKVQHDGQHAVRRDPARRAVERQLAYRNPHPVGAEVSQTENARAVGDDDDLAVRARPVPHHRAHLSAVFRREEHAARALECLREILADAADGRRVHERRDLADLVHQHAVEERLVPVVQVLQHQVLAQRVVGVLAHLPEEGVALLADLADVGGQEAAQPEAVALLRRERGALVPQRVLEQRAALLPRVERRREAKARRVVLLAEGLLALGRGVAAGLLLEEAAGGGSGGGCAWQSEPAGELGEHGAAQRAAAEWRRRSSPRSDLQVCVNAQL